MLEKEFDRLVKDRLTDHTSDVPGDMWQRIRANEKRRRTLPFWRWISGGLLLSAIMLTGAVVFLRHQTPTAHTATTNRAARTAPSSGPAAAGAPVASHTTHTIPVTNTAPNGSTTLANHRDSAVHADPTAGAHTIPATNPTPGATPTATTNRAPRTLVVPVTHSTPAVATTNNPAHVATKPALATTHTVPTHTASTTTPSAPTKLTSAQPPATPTTRERPAVANIHAWAIDPLRLAITTTGPTVPITATAAHSTTTRRLARTATSIPVQPGSPSKPHPDQSKMPRNPNWQLDIYGSPDLLLSEFRRGLGYTYGLRVTKLFNSGWNVSLGLQYSRINLKSAFDSLTTQSNNPYLKDLDLPVLAGYSWGNARFKVGVNAGLIFNLHSTSKEQQQQFLLPPSSSSSMSLSTPSPYVLRYQYKVGTNGYLGVNFAEKLVGGFSLFAEPYLRHTLFPSNVKVNPAPRGITVAGLSLGVRCQF